MKNKKFTYLLGLLVVVVWGVIVYRIISAVTAGAEDDFVPMKKVEAREELNDYSRPADTTHLLLNYKDPFGLVKKPDTVVKAVRQEVAVSTAPSVPKPAFSWNFIKYSGYTRSAGDKKLLAVLSINGQPVILQEGETANEVKLVKNYQDSVKVMFRGRTGYIRMQ